MNGRKHLNWPGWQIQRSMHSETLNHVGFVVDYHDLKPFKHIIDEELDHRHLNDIIPGPTSAEYIAWYLYRRAKGIWPQVLTVRVSETPQTWAEYRE